MRTLFIAALVSGPALLTGCTGADDKEDTGASPDDTGTTGLPVDCADVPPESCAASGCETLSGRAVLNPATPDECIDGEAEALGCQDTGLGCGQAITFAASPEAPTECWYFTNTCVPDGWTKCPYSDAEFCDVDPTGDTGDTSTDCAAVAPDVCDATSGCAAIRGYPILDDGAGGLCTDWDSPTALGCMDADSGCDDAVAVASDPKAPETLWFFTNLCLPTGWTFIASSDYPTCK